MPSEPGEPKHSPIVKLPFLQQEEHHGGTKVPQFMQECFLPPRISVVLEHTAYGVRVCMVVGQR
jgi:hypothetical protein